MKALYDNISLACSKHITRTYSTSFSLGIKSLAREFHEPIYAVYGFVRLADEIVDSFHGFEQEQLLNQLEAETYAAIDQKISINPVLNSFQMVVHQYNIDRYLIAAFLDSMKMDLSKQQYSKELYEKYIYGSAEVVGLMCLKVFTRGSFDEYERLKHPAMKLGAAFQKINFLRDIKADYEGLGRVYFPGVDFNNFCDAQKSTIEAEIERDLAESYEGIKRLPKDARFGVFLAYIYYRKLFRKIKRVPGERILETRIRIPNAQKMTLLLGCRLRNNLNLI